MRNSSLVEGFRAENVTGLKRVTEAVAVLIYQHWVGERSAGREAAL